MTMKPIFSDEDLISSYTRKQAIEDGFLVDITALFPKEAKQLYKFPVAMTHAVYTLVEESAKDVYSNQATVIWDILYMSIHMRTRILSEAEHLFTVLIGAKTQTLKAMCHGGDEGEGVITILLPEED
jgi:hypothetical protein